MQNWKRRYYYEKFLALFLSALLTLSLVVSSVLATSQNDSLYGPYDSFKELYDAYFEAVRDGDEEKQAELMDIARDSLYKEIALSEAQSVQPLYDPEEQYWLAQFPIYFSYGRFEERSDGWTLSLGAKNSGYWTDTDKSNGWNATFFKFYEHPQWDNTDIMKEQFYCHARLFYSSIETEWNLEPWRTKMNFITCN